MRRGAYLVYGCTRRLALVLVHALALVLAHALAFVLVLALALALVLVPWGHIKVPWQRKRRQRCRWWWWRQEHIMPCMCVV